MKISTAIAFILMLTAASAQAILIMLNPEKAMPLDYTSYGMLAALIIFLGLKIAKEEKERQERVQEKMRELDEELRRLLFESLNSIKHPDIKIWTKEEVLFGLDKITQITSETIKTRYKELARLNHPDLGGSEEKMKEVNSAYSALQKKYGFA